MAYVRYRCRGQGLKEGQRFPMVPLVEDVLFQVGIRGKIDGRKWYVSQQARRSATIEA